MGLEIERKFLVDKTKWDKVSKPKGQFLQQGYLLADPQKTIRIRLSDTQGYITIKGLTIGATRKEFEYKIPKDEAKELLDTFSIAGLAKVRYEIMHYDKLWQVDVFQEQNLGLIVAEIELKEESESFDIPDWIDKEVTGDIKYYNSNLSSNPYRNWKK
jgi:CYTH domain-containing protein